MQIVKTQYLFERKTKNEENKKIACLCDVRTDALQFRWLWKQQGTANDNLNDATSGENYDGSGENGNNTGNNAGDQNGDSILDDAVDDVTDGVDDVTDDITNGVDDAADDLTQENGVQNKMQNNE